MTFRQPSPPRSAARGDLVEENFGEIVVRENARRRAHELPPRRRPQSRKRHSRSWPSAGEANTAGLNLTAAGVETDAGLRRVDPHLRTSVPHFCRRRCHGPPAAGPAGDSDGFVAATNAVRGPTMTLGVNPIGSFTDPEYAQVGLTEAQARAAHDVVASTIHFDATAIIDGRTFGFTKLIVDRATHKFSVVTSSANGRSRSRRSRQSPSPPECESTSWLTFRFRFRPMPAYSAAWRPA